MTICASWKSKKKHKHKKNKKKKKSKRNKRMSFVLKDFGTLSMHQLEIVTWKSIWTLNGLLSILVLFRNGITANQTKISADIYG